MWCIYAVENCEFVKKKNEIIKPQVNGQKEKMLYRERQLLCVSAVGRVSWVQLVLCENRDPTDQPVGKLLGHLLG